MDKPFAQPCRLLPEKCVTPDETSGFIALHGKPQPRLERRIFIGYVVNPMMQLLLDAVPYPGMIAIMESPTMRKRQTRQALAVMLSAALCLLAVSGEADVPTVRQQCDARNLAICEFSASGVQSSQPGPCPDGSRTIKPAGTEDCATPIRAARSAMPPSSAQSTANPQHTDLAWVGGIERWLIPVLVYTLIGAVALYAWIVIRRRSVGSSAPSSGAATVLISGACAAFCGWKAATATFGTAFNSFDNHDSAAPLLLATPVSVLTFGVVAGLVFSILTLGWKWLRTRV